MAILVNSSCKSDQFKLSSAVEAALLEKIFIGLF